MTKNQMKCGIIYEKIVMQADDERKHLLLFTVSVRDQAHIFLITKNKNRLNIVTLTFFNVFFFAVLHNVFWWIMFFLGCSIISC